MYRTIIPKFDKVMKYYAQLPRKFFHFTTHLPQHAKYYYLTINKAWQQTNHQNIPECESAKRIQSNYFLKKSSHLMFKMAPSSRNACIQTFVKVCSKSSQQVSFSTLQLRNSSLWLWIEFVKCLQQKTVFHKSTEHR